MWFLVIALAIVCVWLFLDVRSHSRRLRYCRSQIQHLETKLSEANQKEFGLDEARRALKFLNEPDQAKAVMAVVVGILGFENLVSTEANDCITELVEANTRMDVDISRMEAMITARRQDIAKNKNEIIGTRDIIAMFGGSEEEASAITT